MGEFRDRECWDLDLYKACDPEGEFVREEYKGWDPDLYADGEFVREEYKGWDPDLYADGEFGREEYKGWDPDPDKGWYPDTEGVRPGGATLGSGSGSGSGSG